jgi:hypothetical protein
MIVDDGWVEQYTAILDRIVTEQCQAEHPDPLPLDCPLCKSKGSIHIYFSWLPEELWRPNRPDGTSWIWCSVCRSYSSTHWQPPKWWKDSPEIPRDQLFHPPFYLDEHRDIVDAHWNQLISNL